MVERGCGRLEWCCPDRNKPSIDFYLSLGSASMDEWTIYRLTEIKGEVADVLMKHSILKQKFADSLTDALRCKVLEINEYEVNALELIDPEETPKNVLIRAVKKSKISSEDREKLKAEYKAICDMFGINPYLFETYAK